MTIMHGAAVPVLYPPIDDSSSSGDSDSDDDDNNSSVPDVGNSNHDNNNINIRVNCNINSSSTTTPNTNPSSKTKKKRSKTGMSSQLAANFQVLKRAKLEHRTTSNGVGVFDESYRGLAVETARLANDEIERMERAVAELEALVRERGGANGGGDVVIAPLADPGHRFPSLPKVVMVPQDQGEESDDGDDNHDHEDDGDHDSVLEGKPSPVEIVEHPM